MKALNRSVKEKADALSMSQGESLVMSFNDMAEQERFIKLRAIEEAQRMKRAMKNSQKRLLKTTERIEAVKKQSSNIDLEDGTPSSSYVQKCDRILNKCVERDGLSVFEWVDPKVRSELLDSLLKDGQARVEAFGEVVCSTHLEKCKELVKPQADGLYQGPLIRAKDDLIAICIQLGMDPERVNGMTGRELVLLLLSNIRVVPTSC